MKIRKQSISYSMIKNVHLLPIIILPLWPFINFLNTNKFNPDLELFPVSAYFLLIIFLSNTLILLFGYFVKNIRAALLLFNNITITVLQFYYDAKSRLMWITQEHLNFCAVIMLLLALSILLFAAVLKLSKSLVFRKCIPLFSVLLVLFAFLSLVSDPGEIKVSSSINYAVPSRQSELIKTRGNLDKPNIYIFLLDAYLRPDLLASDFGLDNSEWTSNMKEQGFRIGRNTLSNFSTTIYSLNYLLNPTLRHIDDPIKLIKLVKKGGIAYLGEIENEVYKWLIQHGYDFSMVNLRGDTAYCYPHCMTSNLSMTYTELQFLKTTPIYDFIDLYIKTVVKGWMNRVPQIMSDALDKMPMSAGRPRLLFAHMLLPHPPYGRNANCDTWKSREYELSYDSSALTDIETKKALYIAQVKCANKQMLEISQRLIKQDPSALIIFFSDHGWKATYSDRIEGEIPYQYSKKTRHSNMITVRAPDACFKDLDSMTLVDLFPNIFGCVLKLPVKNSQQRLFDPESNTLLNFDPNEI